MDDLTSEALERWRTERRATVTLARDLCTSEPPGTAGHHLVLGTYVTVLVAEFQGFCRELISELARALVGGVPLGVPRRVALALQSAMSSNRAIDAGNPTARNLDRDLRRFGLRLSDALRPTDLARPGRLAGLSALLAVRNSVVHAVADLSTLGPRDEPLTVTHVDSWRRDVEALTVALDEAVRHHLWSTLKIDISWVTEEGARR